MHFMSMSPTTGEWYSRQTRGVKLRMGVVWLQNEALTSEMVLVLDDLLKKEYGR